MLRVVIGRRWKRWLRLSLLLFCLCMIWVFVRDLLQSRNHAANSDEDTRRIYDHWGPDDTDLNWLPRLLAKRSQEIPVVVVEEHYEGMMSGV